jgi:hypothetical protein
MQKKDKRQFLSDLRFTIATQFLISAWITKHASTNLSLNSIFTSINPRFEPQQKNRFTISLPQNVQTGSGVHPASYSVGAGGSFSRVKWLKCEADHFPPLSAEIKNEWSYIFTHLLCLHYT